MQLMPLIFYFQQQSLVSGKFSCLRYKDRRRHSNQQGNQVCLKDQGSKGASEVGHLVSCSTLQSL